jgi:hypothetical protein
MYGENGGEGAERASGKADPMFRLTWDQPVGEYVHSPVPHSFRRRLLFSCGAFARFDATIYNYFSMSFLLTEADLPPAYAVR